jgi:hypothetical protein
MHSITLRRKISIPFTCVFLARLSISFGASSDTNKAEVQEIVSDLHRVTEIRPENQIHSAAEKTELNMIVQRLNDHAPSTTVSVIANNVRNAKRNKEIPAYTALLPRLPSLKQEILQRIAAESDPVTKGRLIYCTWRIKGADVIKTLVAQLDDKRPAEQPAGPSAERVCDCAFNVIYVRVARISELGLDSSTAMSDSIQPGVPIGWRDARIAKLKAGMIAKFGADLKVLDNL